MDGGIAIILIILSTIPSWYYWLRATNNLSEKGKRKEIRLYFNFGTIPDDYFTEEGLFYFKRCKQVVVVPIITTFAVAIGSWLLK